MGSRTPGRRPPRGPRRPPRGPRRPPRGPRRPTFFGSGMGAAAGGAFEAMGDKRGGRGGRPSPRGGRRPSPRGGRRSSPGGDRGRKFAEYLSMMNRGRRR